MLSLTNMSDAELDAYGRAVALRLSKNDPLEFARQFLWIRNEKGKTIRLIPNRNQIKHYEAKQRAAKEGKPRRFLVLKARRMGFSTWEQAESIHLVTNHSGQKAVTLAHTAPATEQIFQIAQHLYNSLENPPKKAPGFKREMSFPELGSSFYIGTAGAPGFGRGDTLQRVHGSEVAFWSGKPEDIDNLVAGLCEATREGEVVLESTANGMGNWFHNTWQAAERGENEWTPLFYPWYDDPSNSLEFGEGEEFIYTEEEDHLARIYDLTPEQVKWWREKKRARGKLVDQEYPPDPATAFIASGRIFFEVDIVRMLLPLCPQPLNPMEAPREIRDGITLWRLPEPNERYVIGADVSEGVGGDYAVAGVLDRKGRQCAVIRSNLWRPESFAKRAACLGEWYNMALLAPEANNHGHSMLNSLRNTHRYPMLYVHADYDKRLNSSKKLGWQTDKKTRPIMLDDLAEAVHSEAMQVNDRVMLEECLTFVDDGSGKYEARDGCHDDTIFAWAIAWQVRARGKIQPGSGTVQDVIRKHHVDAGHTECDWCKGLGFDSELGACHLCKRNKIGEQVQIVRMDSPSWRKF